MRFYFLDTDTYKIKFTEPTELELKHVKPFVRYTNQKHGVILPFESDRSVDLYWTLESNEELIKREYLFEL